jgi:hypothetical protein
MGGTADKSTPLWMPWREALKRSGSFDALRPYLHEGRIPARHGGLYTLSDGKVHSGPGILGPEKWAVVHKDRAGRVIFFTEEVVFGRVVQEEVFAYDISIELDSVAFDTFFPVATVSTIVDKAGLPPAERKLMGPADWFRNAIKDHPKQPNERASGYATRLLGLMKTAPVTKQWTQKTLYRRLYDK